MTISYNPRIIKEKRERKGLSQERLAKLVGYEDRSSINKIEKGNVNIPDFRLKRICSVLHIDYAELLK
ncbi:MULTISPECIES: helix-turn-helix domain-containing protein [Bacillus cereus group]|uniref:helix-turn-helix domain-containing protein n=1 Tax=Bacillus cereus group TaxID=86661 RepID=UPI001F5AF97D|nr:MULTISPECIES: helix-turn-helix transcriptional regulator [unclassified Bacillus cereus group]EMA6344847.1 helix-turn-helix transcriptional regulator [Bacillus cytotoxicus]